MPKKPKLLKEPKKRQTTPAKAKYRPSLDELKIFGAILVAKRTKMDISGSQMARHLGISQSSWSRFEGGTRAINLEILRIINGKIPIVEDVVRYIRTGTFREKEKEVAESK